MYRFLNGLLKEPITRAIKRVTVSVAAKTSRAAIQDSRRACSLGRYQVQDWHVVLILQASAAANRGSTEIDLQRLRATVRSRGHSPRASNLGSSSSMWPYRNTGQGVRTQRTQHDTSQRLPLRSLAGLGLALSGSELTIPSKSYSWYPYPGVSSPDTAPSSGASVSSARSCRLPFACRAKRRLKLWPPRREARAPASGGSPQDGFRLSHQKANWKQQKRHHLSFSCFAVCHPLQSRKRPASSSLSCSTRSCSSSVRRPSNSALGIVHIRTRCSLSGFAWPRAVAQSWVSRTAPCRGGHIDHGCILPLPESAKMAMCPCSATSQIATAQGKGSGSWSGLHAPQSRLSHQER